MCVQPLSVELGPGILENIFDGIQVCLLVFSVKCVIWRSPELNIFMQFEVLFKDMKLYSQFSFFTMVLIEVYQILTTLITGGNFWCLFPYAASTEGHRPKMWRCVHPPWCCSACFKQGKGLWICTKEPWYIVILSLCISKESSDFQTSSLYWSSLFFFGIYSDIGKLVA